MNEKCRALKVNEINGAGSNSPEVTRREASKLVAAAVGLGCGLGLTRVAAAAPPAAELQYLVNGKESVVTELPAEIATALANKNVVELLTKVNGIMYRANFKIEIEG